MTDFNKVSSYYNLFDEWGRLEAPEGRLEFDLCLPIIKNHLRDKSEILDLGGGPGRYTIELAKSGHILHLADLSQTLLDQAKEKIDGLRIDTVKSIRQVNATDLSAYDDCSFDAVLLFGPLYHLTNADERISCVKEVGRVLKPKGLVFVNFIPRLSGAVGAAARMFNFPDQVNIETLTRVFNEGIFNNNANRGFQEGYYPASNEIESLFVNNGFSKVLLRSIRGWGSRYTEQIYKLKNENFQEYEKIIELINKTADDPSIIETCSHALYIGQKA